ncbi:MAG: hypothetical protein QXO56_02400 [Candidatus Pacearchaeota archaeon]
MKTLQTPHTKATKAQKAQITLFVIIALVVIVAGIAGYFLIKPRGPKLPPDIKEIENSYVSCLADLTKQAIELAEQRGGYIYELEQTQEGLYFSNALDFMGERIAYWFYYDSSGKPIEQVPSLSFIESQIARYVMEHIELCDDVLRASGISFEKKPVRIEIAIGKKVEGKALIDLKLSKQNATYLIREHSFTLDSELKQLYETARAIYDYESSSRFLENYTLDVLTLYAPTTGFELQCMPLTFEKEKIKKDIIDGLTVNLERIKFAGDYFSLASEENKYYVNDVKIPNGIYVNILGPLKPIKIEIYGDERNGIFKFDPIGKQPGLAMLNSIGFCYVPYHFVYDIKYPLLIEVSGKKELFKFPITVVLERNGVKEMLTEGESVSARICNSAITEAIINVYDESGKPLDAELYFKCLDAVCYLGKAEQGYLEAKVPECVNGFLIASLDGYAQESLQLDSTHNFIGTLFLSPLYSVKLELNLRSDESALILFEGKTTASINYPEQKEVKLAEGSYEVSVYVFKQKSLSIVNKSELCYDVPVFFGMTRKQCVELEGMSFDNVVVGGGKTSIELSEEMLARGKLRIDFERFSEPREISDLETNYELVDASELKIS